MGAWIVAVAFGTAVASQLLLIGWLVRIYPTIPRKIPHGSSFQRQGASGSASWILTRRRKMLVLNFRR